MRTSAKRRSGRGSSATTAADNPFLALLASVQRQVSERLEKLLKERVDAARPYGPELVSMVEALSDLCSRGGKRLRPALLVAGARAASKRYDAKLALTAGVALELVQAYFLIHDDWMDGDATRRGGPSVHALLAKRFGDSKKGDASAILAGDYAAALAARTLSDAALSCAAASQILASFSRMQLDAVVGQHLDLFASAGDPETAYALKTGSYTVLGPLELGARLAGAKPPALRALAGYARPLGIAFQLRDDLLGAYGEPERTGKPLGNDLRCGKRTLLLIEALSRTRGAERARIERVVGDPKAADRDVRRALELIESSGARARVEARIEELSAQARSALARGRLTADGVALLNGAVDALTERRH
jgi:geranylgeranyl diphosphate synthase type I